jgi:hypothetical protein
LLAGGVAIVSAIIYWEKLVAWWNNPAAVEGNGDLDEDEE